MPDERNDSKNIQELKKQGKRRKSTHDQLIELAISQANKAKKRKKKR